MKKVITFALVLILALSLSAPAFAETLFANVTENGIVFQDDGTGESRQDKDMVKRVLATTRDIGYQTELDGALITVNGLQVSNACFYNGMITALYGLEKDAAYTLITVDVTVENTGAEDLYLSLSDAFVITNTKEQVRCNEAFSKEFGGVLLPGAEKEDQIFFFCPKTSIFDFESFRFLFNAPARANGEPIGDRLDLTFRYLENGLSSEAKELVRETADLMSCGFLTRSDFGNLASFWECTKETEEAALAWLRIDWQEQAVLVLQDWIDTVKSYNEPAESQEKYLSYEFLFGMLTNTDGFTEEEALAALAACEISP